MRINTLLKDTSIYVGLSFVQKGLSFLLIPFYTFFLTPDEFGLVNQIVALHSIYILILTFSLNESLALNISEENKNVAKECFNIVFINIVFVIIGGMCMILFDKYLYDSIIVNLTSEIKYISILIALTSPIFYIYQKYLRIKQEIILYSKMMLSYIIIQVIFSVIFIYVLDLGAFGYMLSIGIVSALFGLISYYNLFVPKFQYLDLITIKTQIVYASKLVPHTVAGWGLNGFTNVALGKISSLSLVGIFNAVNIVGVFINVISKSILDAIQPWLYSKLKLKTENGFEEVSLIISTTCYVLSCIGLLLLSLDNIVLEYAIDDNYHEGIKYAPLLVLNSLCLAFGSMSVYVIYYYRDKVQYVSISTIIGGIVNIFLGYFLINMYDLVGALISLIIANIITSLIKIKLCEKILIRRIKIISLSLIMIFMCFINFYYDNAFIHFVNIVVLIYLLKVVYINYKILDKVL